MSLSDIEQALSSLDWGRAAVIITAIATLVLAAATVRLAGATRKSAKETERAVTLQADQLDVVKQQLALQSDELDTIKRQLTLAEDQAREATALSRPILRAGIESYDEYTAVTLHWAHGTAPATDIEVWVRTHHGLRVARHDVMTPGDQAIHLFAMPASADDVSERLPFERLAHALPQPTQMWVGIDYRGPDGKVVGWSEWTRSSGVTVDEDGNPIGGTPIEKVKGPGPSPRSKEGQ